MDKSKFWPLAAACLLTAVITGCNRGEDNPTAEIDLSRAPDRQVLIRVGAGTVTAGDFRARLALETQIYTHKNEKRPDFKAALARYRESRVGAILPLLANQALLAHYVKTSGVVLPEDQKAFVLKSSLARCGWRDGVTAAAKSVGVAPEFLELQFLQAALTEKAREHFDPSCLTVTDAEIDEGLARQTAYYERAVATNAITYAACSNVLAKVVAGADFAATGAKVMGDDAEEAVRWGVFEYDELDTDEIRKWAFEAPIGAIGGPFALDDGLAIVKILERNDGALRQSMAAESVADVTLARINFPLVVEEPEPRTRDYVRKALLKWKGERAQERLFASLMEAHPLVYPQGTNFVFKVEQ